MKPKVAIVRGPGLSNWEMQVYEPLTKWFDLTAIGSTIPVNDIQNIQIPIKKLTCFPQYIANIPKMMHVMFSLFGCTQWLSGFDEAVSGYDIVHSVELFNGYTVQAVRAKKKGLIKNVTLTVHENIPFLFREYPAKMALKQEVIEGADLFLAINEMSRQMLLLEGVDEKKIVMIPQSVNTDLFRPKSKTDTNSLRKLRSTFGYDNNDFVVLSAGRMVWEKGWYDLIPAALKVSKHHKRIKFLCIGDGPERQKIERFAHEQKLKSVMKFAAVPYIQMSDIFRMSDLFVYPTLPMKLWNAQWGGGVIAEAMATGLPIIATSNGGVVDLIGDGGNIVVQLQRFGVLADAIVNFSHDSKLREKVGVRNRKRAEKLYCREVVATQIKDKWDEIIR